MPEMQKGSCTMKKVLIVEGMMCAHCQAHVQKALADVEGVTEAAVDPGQQTGDRYPGKRCGRPNADGCSHRSRLHPCQLHDCLKP